MMVKASYKYINKYSFLIPGDWEYKNLNFIFNFWVWISDLACCVILIKDRQSSLGFCFFIR